MRAPGLPPMRIFPASRPVHDAARKTRSDVKMGIAVIDEDLSRSSALRVAYRTAPIDEAIVIDYRLRAKVIIHSVFALVIDDKCVDAAYAWNVAWSALVVIRKSDEERAGGIEP
ncbi:MAG: hypothetical protein ACLSVD_15195 [Eggerthellaceae bacterium]